MHAHTTETEYTGPNSNFSYVNRKVLVFHMDQHLNVLICMVDLNLCSAPL